MPEFLVKRSDGRYFTGPAQMEHYSWSPHLEDALVFYKIAEAERIRDGRPEIPGIEVMEAPPK